MPHDLETINGQTFFAAREDAWHKLGQIVGTGMTVMEAMQYAHLGGWNVRKEALIIPGQKIEYVDENTGRDAVRYTPDVPVTGKFGVVRDNPITGKRDYLGVVGNDYTPIQNEDNAEFLQTVTDEFGATIETAGSLGGGADVFITMKLPQTMTVTTGNGGQDVTELYLAALNNHTGSSAFRLILTPIRIVCRNTQQWALRSAKSVWSVRHTVNATQRVQVARETLGLAFNTIDTIDAEFQRMANEQYTLAEAETFVNALVDVDGVDPESQAAVQRKNRADAILNLFQNSPTIQNIAGTRYAMYNAVTEYVDWFAGVRGVGGNATEAQKQEMRAYRTIQALGNNTSLKAVAFDKLRVPASV